jgi:hypothetical protein
LSTQLHNSLRPRLIRNFQPPVARHIFVTNASWFGIPVVFYGHSTSWKATIHHQFKIQTQARELLRRPSSAVEPLVASRQKLNRPPPETALDVPTAPFNKNVAVRRHNTRLMRSKEQTNTSLQLKAAEQKQNFTAS